ncbi:Ferric iron ABC transporter, ATP-binding protein [Cronobacter condimenti 1330]|uniref:Ferric iron ABC transporter, ATP-binding protein n=1 Tax=Cronobacter condimenti 1330 TaxID=1073999 RepID=K8AEF4_9ENTR|nr:ABC transporter ATP-binding protein [Cronobacter condimenti]ALB63016.1 putrescine/spermidine ABC transporter ATPase [Cronobacter condimenti 1330]CCJ74139.1 Ferric iron ABC transporter, ATP-binding protein [Cronobacter condimenti 1330]
MSYLDITRLKMGYGDHTVLHDIDLSVHRGEMIALLGPSGCGKTSLLNALCGFVQVESGDISVGGRTITRLPPEQRNIIMVFQSYALWPHLTVAQNIGFGLTVRKQPKTVIQAQIKKMLALVNLTGLENRKISALSGGQRQRVALARALAVEPDVLVLDEPLSNLDARVRLSVRHEIKTLQQQLGFTSLIVTHDQEEALVMADRVAVLNQGCIEQIGTPQDIWRHPQTPFVADFMGATNRVRAQAGETLCFRSSDVTISAAPGAMPGDGLTLSGIVRQSAFMGQQYRHSVQVDHQLLQADSAQNWPVNTTVALHVPPQALHRFNQP